MKKYLATILGILILAFVSPIIARAEDTNVEIVDTSDHIYTYDEMVEDLFGLAYKYPGCLWVNSIGVTADQRPIYQAVLGNPNAPNAIYIQASIHGREWLNTMMIMKQIENNLINWNVPLSLTETYGSLYNKCCIYIVPMVNPDGVTISQLGIEGIANMELRAYILGMSGSNNPARWKANALGVDLNRNFSVGWSQGSSKVKAPASSGYKGIVPFSENETMAVAQAISQRNFDYAVSYHSYEGAIYWNNGQEGELLEKNTWLATYLSNVTGYKMTKSDPVHGLDYNYFILEKGIPTVLIETGYTSCPLPYSEWESLWTQNQNVMFALALAMAY
jgi:g-D-glutamyl-meso-diaminopimelate peptidase